MSKELTVREAAKFFLPLAGLFVVGFLIIALGGSEPTPRPAVTLSEPLQDALGLLLVSVVACVGQVALLTVLARHRARTADKSVEHWHAKYREEHDKRMVALGERDKAERRAKDAQDQSASLQAINAALIDERNAAEQRVKELERAAAMHHQAMLHKQEEKADLVMDKVIAIGAWFHENPSPGVAATRAYLRQHKIEVTNEGYKKLSAFVQSLAPLPHHEPSPVRDAATEREPANAPRERANGRRRTHPRTVAKTRKV